MITRITGLLETIDDGRAVIAPGSGGAGFAYEVLLPAFLAVELATRMGKPVTLVTLEYLEGQGQGSSFIPRLVGFADVRQRAFFELFTTVNGIGNRKALRALARPPAAIARAIAEKDAKTLSTLPEIGKRMAERVIAELDGKVEAYLEAGAVVEGKPVVRAGAGAGLGPSAVDAVAALVALGQQRGEAEEKVRRVLARDGEKKHASADEIVAAVFGG
ncbi:MAG: Holliday junction branch migration protein RuvA [Phycisphaerales bacterium]